MQIKRFEAQTMSDALRLIKQEFGSEAVILSARGLKKHNGVLRFMQKPGVEVTAATDSSNPHVMNNDSPTVWKKQGAYRDISALQAFGRKKSLFDSLQGEVSGLKQRFNPLGRRKQSHQHNAKGLFALYQQMLSQGVSEDIAMGLVEKVDRAASSNALMTHEEMKSHLARILKEEGIGINSLPERNGKQKIVGVVGPTGVGKTSTVAKLAAIQAIGMRKRVGLVTLDDQRIGAIEQLKICAKIMGVSLEVASSSKALRKALKKLKDKDVVLVDTPGVSPKDGSMITELKSFLDAISSITVYLALSATTKEEDLVHIIDTFTCIPIDGLLFTKLDESSTNGALLNQALRTKAPLSYFATGQQIPEGIEIASVEKLVDLLIDEYKEKQSESRSVRTIRRKDLHVDEDTPYFDERYVVNKNSEVFHYPHCKRTKTIKEENLIVYKSRREIENHNLKPCRLCCPEDSVPANLAPVAVESVASHSY